MADTKKIVVTTVKVSGGYIVPTDTELEILRAELDHVFSPMQAAQTR